LFVAILPALAKAIVDAMNNINVISFFILIVSYLLNQYKSILELRTIITSM